MGIRKKIKDFILQEREKNGFLWRVVSHILSVISSKIQKETVFSGAILYKCEILGGGIVRIGKGSYLKDCRIYVCGEGSSVEIGDNCVLKSAHIFVSGNNGNCYIGNNVTVNAIKSSRTEFNIGENSKIQIEDGSLFSKGIVLFTTDFHSVYDSKKNRINKNSDIYIGYHVWIGMYTLILKGSSIANNCVIGAGSLVTGKNDTENSIYIGRPAVLKKTEINWEK
jgi:acetyltransferase-like isoleucine patch superfamily enzyme